MRNMEQELGLLRKKVTLLESKLQELQDEIDKKVNNALRKFFEYRAKQAAKKARQFEDDIIEGYFSQFEEQQIGIGSSIDNRKSCTESSDLRLESCFENDGKEDGSVHAADFALNDQAAEVINFGGQEETSWDDDSILIKTEVDDDYVVADEDLRECDAEPASTRKTRNAMGKKIGARALSLLARGCKGLPYHTELTKMNRKRIVCEGYAYNWKGSNPDSLTSYWRCQKLPCKGRGMLNESEQLFYPYKATHSCPRRVIGNSKGGSKKFGEDFLQVSTGEGTSAHSIDQLN